MIRMRTKFLAYEPGVCAPLVGAYLRRGGANLRPGRTAFAPRDHICAPRGSRAVNLGESYVTGGVRVRAGGTFRMVMEVNSPTESAGRERTLFLIGG